jgi:hypothetical protein
VEKYRESGSAGSAAEAAERAIEALQGLEYARVKVCQKNYEWEYEVEEIDETRKYWHKMKKEMFEGAGKAKLLVDPLKKWVERVALWHS